MTDDEVRQWLSEEERMHFDSAAVVIIEDRRSPVPYAALRSLAATRRALAHATCDSLPQDVRIAIAFVDENGHGYTMTREELRAFVLAMPRPPQTR